MIDFLISAYSVSIGSFRSATDPLFVGFGARFTIVDPIQIKLSDDDGRINLDALSETNVTVGDDDQGPVTLIGYRIIKVADSDVGVRIAVLERSNVADHLLVPIGPNGAFSDELIAPGTQYVATETFEGPTSILIESVAEELTYFADADGDGFGVDDPETTVVSEEDPGAGFSLVAGDADDSDATVFPDAPEINDGKDNDQDGETDEDNRAPIADDDVATVEEDGSIAIAVLGNDEDPDGDMVNIKSAGNGANGTTTVNGDGTITYTPDADFNGEDSFTYVIEDGFGGEDSAEVKVTVTPDDPNPIVVEGSAGSEFLQGTDEADTILAGGGSDFLTGNGGADTLVFAFAGGNGREVATVTDYDAEDLVDLGGAEIVSSFAGGGSLFVFLDTGDFDTIIFNGVSSIDEIKFVEETGFL